MCCKKMNDHTVLDTRKSGVNQRPENQVVISDNGCCVGVAYCEAAAVVPGGIYVDLSVRNFGFEHGVEVLCRPDSVDEITNTCSGQQTDV